MRQSTKALKLWKMLLVPPPTEKIDSPGNDRRLDWACPGLSTYCGFCVCTWVRQVPPGIVKGIFCEPLLNSCAPIAAVIAAVSSWPMVTATLDAEKPAVLVIVAELADAKP